MKHYDKLILTDMIHGALSRSNLIQETDINTIKASRLKAKHEYRLIVSFQPFTRPSEMDKCTGKLWAQAGNTTITILR